MTTPTGSGSGGARGDRAAAGRALGVSFVVCWFLLAAMSHATGPLQTLPWLFVEDIPRAPLVALLGAMAVAGFAAPMLPLGAPRGRDEVATHAGRAAILAGLLVRAGVAAAPAWRAGIVLPLLTTAAAVVGTAAGALYLNAVIGLMNRRAVAGGMVGALLLRQIVVHVSYDATGMGGSWVMLGAAIVLAAAGFALIGRWRRAPAEHRADSFERRAGGMRLRGAIAFGVLLFFELGSGLPLAATVDLPFTTPVQGALAAALGMVPLALAWLFVVRGGRMRRHRALAVVLSLILTFGVVLPFQGPRSYVALALAGVLAQSAAFMLFERALAPASGRRSGRKLATGLLVFAALVVAWAAALVFGAAGGRMIGSGLVLVAGIVLTVATYLTPRPVPAAAPLADRWLFGIAFAVPLLALLAASV